MSSRTPTRSGGSGSPSPAAVVARSAGPTRWWWRPGGCSRRRERGPHHAAPGRAAGHQGAFLYKHLPDKAALEAAIIATGLEEAAVRFEQAVDSARRGGDAAGVRRCGDFGACGGVSGVCAGASSSLPVDAQRATSSAASAGWGRGPCRGAGVAGCREPGAGSSAVGVRPWHGHARARPAVPARRRPRRGLGGWYHGVPDGLTSAWYGRPVLRGSGDRMEVWR